MVSAGGVAGWAFAEHEGLHALYRREEGPAKRQKV